MDLEKQSNKTINVCSEHQYSDSLTQQFRDFRFCTELSLYGLQKMKDWAYSPVI